jgi:glycosyltransferase EpsJ
VKPKVSVVIPVYKAESTLRRCLESVIHQTLKEIQIILVDDGSPDQSGTICDEYARRDMRVKVIHKENGGESNARNDGMRNADGQYIGFVDSDDYVEPDMYEVLYSIAESQNVDIVSCGHYFENADGVMKLTTRFEKNRVLVHNDVLGSIQTFEDDVDDFWFAWRNIYRRSFLEENAILFEPTVKYGPDTNFNLLAFFHARSSYATDKHLYHYVENPNGIMCAKYKEDYLDHLTKTYRKRVEFYESIGFDDESSLRGLSTTVIERFLTSLLFNAWESPGKDFLQQARAIRSSSMVSESFKYYKASRRLSSFLQLVVSLMKKRMYRLIYVLFVMRSP